MNIYEKLLHNQRKYLSDKGTIDVNARIENLKKLKNNIYELELDNGSLVKLYDDVIVKYSLLINKKIDSKLKVTHIHDNYGTDSHNQPFDGTINWDDVRKALTDINYDGELTSEVRYTIDELSDSTNINKTYDLIQKIHQG